MDRRRALLVAALGFALLERWQSVRELVTLHAWLDTWSGLGAIVVGMQRHGYDLSLTHDRSGWRATFLHRSHVLHPWVGQVLHWWPTPWRAVQEAAWRALHTAFARDYSLSEESPRRARAVAVRGSWRVLLGGDRLLFPRPGPPAPPP